MKANLIYDMRHDDDSWFDKFSREDRGQAVLDVLESARHAQEFGKIMKSLTTIDLERNRELVTVESIIELSQNVRW